MYRKAVNMKYCILKWGMRCHRCSNGLVGLVQEGTKSDQLIEKKKFLKNKLLSQLIKWRQWFPKYVKENFVSEFCPA